MLGIFLRGGAACRGWWLLVFRLFFVGVGCFFAAILLVGLLSTTAIFVEVALFSSFLIGVACFFLLFSIVGLTRCFVAYSLVLFLELRCYFA